MSLPVGTPTEFELARVEVKKVLPAKDGRPERAILRLGCKHGEQKGWVELFEDNDPARFPQEGQKITLVLEAPKQEGWAYNGKRPGKSGGGGRGRQKTPEELREERASIEAQVALKAAVEMTQGDLSAVKRMTLTCAEALREAKDVLR